MLGLPNLFNLMSQAQGAARAMKEGSEQARNTRLEGVAGDGAVRVVVSGTSEILECHIDPELAAAAGYETLGRWVVEATESALSQARGVQEQLLRDTLGGSVPGLANMMNLVNPPK